MTPRVQQTSEKVGACGCGRSPTGYCIGWHGLSQDDYLIEKNKWELDEYRNQAAQLWNDSCTSGKSE
jgi:hypothetical protein